MRARRLLILVPILLALGVTVAVAFWTATGSSSAGASVGTLNAPTDVAASATPGSSTVVVTWTASTAVGAVEPAGYYVLRHASAGGTSPACGSTPSSLVSATTCSDTAVAGGSYSYSVVAAYASWTAASTPSSAVTVTGDGAAPAVTLTSPAHGSATNSPTPALGGAAGDATGDSSIVTVRIYNGSGTGGTVDQTLLVTRSGATWSTSATALAQGTYTAQATQTDTAGNSGTSAANTFTVDPAPSVTVNQRAGQSDPATTLPILWTVTFSEAVTGFDAGDLTRGGTATGGTVSVSGSGSSYEISLAGSPTNGTTTFAIAAATAQDLAGNDNTGSISTDNNVTYDSVAPSTTIATSPASPDGTNAWFKQSSVSFTLAATDATSGVAGRFYTLDGGAAQAYSGAVSVTGQGAHTVTYWSTDVAGNVESASSTTIKLDNVGPTNALSLTGKTGGGSFLSDSTLFYQGAAAGSFRMQNTSTDATSGASFGTFEALGGTSTGWTHITPDVQTSPSGGPFASNVFAWDSGTVSTPTEVVSGVDAAGNTTVAPALTFTNDSTAPAGGSIGYTSGFLAALSVPVALTDGTDTGAGIDPAARVVQRDQVAPTATGACATFPGTFATSVTLAGGADTGVLTNTCYRYRFAVSDRVGNQATYTSTSVAKVDNTAPIPASIAAANGSGSAGQIDKGVGPGNTDDTLTFTYADAFGVNPATVAVGLAIGAPRNVEVIFTNDGGTTGNDTITVPGLGIVDLGSRTWLTTSSSKTEALSTPALNQFVITIGSNRNGTSTGNPPSSFSWTTTGTATDGAGNSATGSVTRTAQSF